jgi:hypothetical protein
MHGVARGTVIVGRKVSEVGVVVGGLDNIATTIEGDSEAEPGTRIEMGDSAGLSPIGIRVVQRAGPDAPHLQWIVEFTRVEHGLRVSQGSAHGLAGSIALLEGRPGQAVYSRA